MVTLHSMGCKYTTFQMFRVYCSKDALNWSKVTGKTFMMLQNISVSNKCCFFFYQRILKKVTVSTKILSSTVFNIDNKKCFLSSNQHIRMISEGSCDTLDWSNGCWKFRFTITGKKHLKNNSNRNAILLFLLYFLSNKCRVGEPQNYPFYHNTF